MVLLIKVLVVAPVIGMILMALFFLISSCKGRGDVGPSYKMPDGEEYKNNRPAPTQNPGIAEQFDGRLTNVFKNPMEGIL